MSRHDDNFARTRDAISRFYGMFSPDDPNIPDSQSTIYEQFDYLGLSTVVGRLHPEPGIDLVYYREPGDTLTGDGGDQYTGLDRFGRIADQRWTDTSGADRDAAGGGA